MVRIGRGLGSQAQWAMDGLGPPLRTRFPLIKGLVWCDSNKEADWRISSSPTSEAAFIHMANDPYFSPQEFQHE